MLILGNSRENAHQLQLVAKPARLHEQLVRSSAAAAAAVAASRSIPIRLDWFARLLDWSVDNGQRHFAQIERDRKPVRDRRSSISLFLSTVRN